MDLEDGGSSPEALAANIHTQLGSTTGSVPVHSIARGLDIEEIREEAIASFEGVLVTDRLRSRGRILINSSSLPRRKRFTLAHELGHFLIAWHEPDGDEGFRCRSDDLAIDLSADRGLRTRQAQEAEANRFAIELLAPAPRVERHLQRIPDLEQVCAMADELDISRTAAARRYIALHGAPLALVVTRLGAVEYVYRAGSFPFVRLSRGTAAPRLPRRSPGGDLSNHDEADPRDWVSRALRSPLIVQTLHQRDDWALTLLFLESTDSDSDNQ